MYKLIIKYLLYAVAFAVLIISIDQCRKSNLESKRLKKNQTALNSPVKTYKTKSGKSAIKSTAVTYTKKELQRYHPEVIKTAKDAGIRPADIISVTQVSFLAKVDTSVSVSTNNDSTVCFKYQDKNFDIYGCLNSGNKMVKLEAEYQDSLTIIPNKVPHRFLFIRWGCKAINLDIISENKSTVFKYAKHIEIK